MLSLLIGLALADGQTPTGDVWVYPHSSNPGAEAILRVWGDGESELDPNYPSEGNFSYGFLQWKLGETTGKTLKSARLDVFAQTNAELAEADFKAFPVVAYPLSGPFEETTFFSTNVEPRPLNSVLGKSKATLDGDAWKLSIDLLSEEGKPFAKLVEKAMSGSKVIGIALATKSSPSDSRGKIYRIHSKEGPETRRPRLFLEWE